MEFRADKWPAMCQAAPKHLSSPAHRRLSPLPEPIRYRKQNDTSKLNWKFAEFRIVVLIQGWC